MTELRGIPERTITLDCDVLQADGGTRCAAITSACVALAIALAKLMREGVLKRWPGWRPWPQSPGICATAGSGSRLCGRLGSGRDCNVVGTASGNFVEIQTAERRPFTQPQLLELLALVAGAIESTNL